MDMKIIFNVNKNPRALHRLVSSHQIWGNRREIVLEYNTMSGIINYIKIYRDMYEKQR